MCGSIYDWWRTTIFVSRHVRGVRTANLHGNALMLLVSRCDRVPRIATFCVLCNHTASICCFVLVWCPFWCQVAHRRTIVMDGDDLLEPYLSCSLTTFRDGRSLFGCTGGGSRTVARSDIKWRDGTTEWWVDQKLSAFDGVAGQARLVRQSRRTRLKIQESWWDWKFDLSSKRA